MVNRYTALIVLTLASCAPKQPGRDVTRDFTDAWGCDYDEVAAQSSELRKKLKHSQQYTPIEGWTACEVLIHVGRPTATNISGDHASWTYRRDEYHGGLVELTRDDGGWIVAEVDW